MVFSLGIGINTVSNQTVDRAIDPRIKAIPQPVPNVINRTELAVLTSLNELERQFELKTGAEALQALLDVKMELSRVKRITSNELYYVLHSRCETHVEVLKTPYKLTGLNHGNLPVPVAAIPPPEEESPSTLLNRDIARFYQRYGDSFISQITWGRTVSLVIQFSFSSLDQQTAFNTELSTPDKELPLGAHFTAKLKHLSKKAKVNYQVHDFSCGIEQWSGGICSTLDEVEEAINHYIDPQNQLDPVQLSKKSLYYTAATNIPNACLLENRTRDVKNVMLDIQKFYELATACRKCFNFVLNNKISLETFALDEKYEKQKRDIDCLEKILIKISALSERIITSICNQEQVKQVKGELNRIVHDLEGISNNIYNGFADETLIVKVPKELIRHVSHEKTPADHFVLPIPEGATHIRAKLIPESDQVGLKLKLHSDPDKKGKMKTTFTQILYHNQEIPVADLAKEKEKRYYIKPKKTDNKFWQKRPIPSFRHDVAIYAIKRVERPNRNLNPTSFKRSTYPNIVIDGLQNFEAKMP